MIIKHKETNKYSFVNLSKGHICRCIFDSIDDAILDLVDYKNKGKIVDFIEIDKPY